MNAAAGTWLGQLRALPRACARQTHTSRRRRAPIGFQGPEGHGEKIWVFAHRRSDQVIYSFNDRLDGFHGLKQLPFNGKKTKPAKLRKDYWAPMAMMQFPAGQGAVGRSVFQKLRELKHLHEVAWPDEFRYKRPDEYTADDRKRMAKEEAEGNKDYRPVRNKQDRGLALNAQKTNAIADMAAVLAGQGAGNKMVAGELDKGDKGDKGGKGPKNKGEKQLVEVSVRWANDLDREYAESWSSNVTHGLFEAPPPTASAAPEPAAQEANAEAA